MNELVIAAIWLSTGAAGFTAGLLGIASTRRRLEDQVEVTEPVRLREVREVRDRRVGASLRVG